MLPSSGLLSMGSVRTAKAERRMKDKLQQEVSIAMHVLLGKEVVTGLEYHYKLHS
jgi:hypothetical protein